MNEAYTAFRETEPCKRCGEGESWTVKGPNGACIGRSWTGDEATTTMNNPTESGSCA